MKPTSSNRFRSLATIGSAFSVAFFIHFAASSATAQALYWDNDGATPGFGTAAGTWAVPTTGDATQGWSTDATGATLPVNVTTTTGNTLNFGTSAAALAAGTITVSGTVSANQLTIPAVSGGINLSGGEISLGGTSPSITANNQSSVIGSAITLGANGVISFCRSTSTAGLFTINGQISGNHNLTFTTPNVNTGGQPQVILLGNANTYTGNTLLTTPNLTASRNNTTTIRAGVANALPTTTVLTIDGGEGTATVSRTTSYDMNSNNQTLAGLTNVVRARRNQTISNTGGGGVTLTLNNTLAHSFSGNISGANISLVKSGVGTQTLAASNGYTGTTTITGGKLVGVVGGNCANSKVIINNTLGTFGISVTDNTKTWTCKELAPTAAGEIEFSFGAVIPSTTVSPLTITVPVALTGLADFTAATPKIRVTAAAPLDPGTYPLITWDTVSVTVPTTADLIPFPLLPQTAANLVVSGNTLNLVITSTAGSAVKANNIDNLNLGTSWVGGTAPDSSKVAIWNSTVTTANTTDLGVAATWAGISIQNPNGSVIINGSSTLTLGNAAIDIDLSTANTADLNLNCPLALGADNIWDVATTRTVTLGGQISGAFPIIKQGDGTVVLSSAANNYSSATTVAAGTLQLGASNVIPDGIGNGNVSVAGNLDLNGKSETINGLSGAGIIDNTLAATTSTLTVGGNDQTSTFAGVIQNTAGTLSLAKTGTGTLTLGSANTFSGTVTISPGTSTLALDNITPLNNVSGITIGADATLRPGFTGTVLQAPITLGGSATNTNITAPLFPGNNAGATTPKTLDLQSKITGSGDLTLLGVNGYNQYGTIILSAQSDYTGTTLITTASGYAGAPVDNAHIFVRLNTENALPVTTVVTLDGGIAEPLSSGRNCELNLNGNDQTLAGLANVARPALRIQRVCDRSGGVSSMLTINNATDFTYSGFLGSSNAVAFSNFGVTKGGAGKQTFSGTIGYSGNTIVNQGILSLGVLNQGTVNNNASTVTIANTGAFLNLTFAGSDTVDKLFIGAIQQVAGVYGRVGSGAQFEISQITGDGTLTVSSSPGFSSWIASTFASGTIPLDKRGANDDYDNDGISNLVEYGVAGEDPTVSKAAIGSFNGTLLSFSKRLDASGLTYAIQESTDLGAADDWTEVTGGSYVNDATTISYTLTPGTPVKNFVRLKVLSN